MVVVVYLLEVIFDGVFDVKAYNSAVIADHGLVLLPDAEVVKDVLKEPVNLRLHEPLVNDFKR